MGDSVTKKPIIGLIQLLLFTLSLLATFLILDRYILMKTHYGTWAETNVVSGLPPAYLTRTLAWPPKRILTRGGQEPGWWWGIEDLSKGQTVLWIGFGAEPLPDEIKYLAPCIRDSGKCAEGWSFTSVQSKGGVLYVFSRLSEIETKRIVEGLRIPREP